MWAYLLACILSLGLLADCAIPIKPDVGAVVVAPKVKLSDPPLIVQTTVPMPVSYFQQSFLDDFSSVPKKPTTSMAPTPAAGLTPSR